MHKSTRRRSHSPLPLPIIRRPHRPRRRLCVPLQCRHLDAGLLSQSLVVSPGPRGCADGRGRQRARADLRGVIGCEEGAEDGDRGGDDRHGGFRYAEDVEGYSMDWDWVSGFRMNINR